MVKLPINVILCISAGLLSVPSGTAFANTINDKCILDPLGKNNSAQCKRIYKRITYTREINPTTNIYKFAFSPKNCIRTNNNGENYYCGFSMRTTHKNLLKFLANSLSVSFGKKIYGGTSCAAPSTINNNANYETRHVKTYRIVCYKNMINIPFAAMEDIGEKNKFNNASFFNKSEIKELFNDKPYNHYFFSGYIEEEIGDKIAIAQVCSSRNSCSGTNPQPAFLNFDPVVINPNGTTETNDGFVKYYTGLLPLEYIKSSITNSNGKNIVYIKNGQLSKVTAIKYTGVQNKPNRFIPISDAKPNKWYFFWFSNPGVYITKNNYSTNYSTIIRRASFKFLTKSGEWVYVNGGFTPKSLSIVDIRTPKSDYSKLIAIKHLPNIKKYYCKTSNELKNWVRKIHAGYSTVCGVITSVHKNTITLINNKMENSTYPSTLLFSLQKLGVCSIDKAEKNENEKSVILCNPHDAVKHAS